MSRKPKRIIRADVHQTPLNAGKARVVVAFVRDYRKAAMLLARRQWRLVFEIGATDKRANDDKDLNALIGAAPVQMARFQVAEQIEGWVANRRNDFRDAVERSSLPKALRHQLHLLNRWKAIFAAGDIVHPKKGHVVWKDDPAVRALAQSIWRAVRKRHRKPVLHRISPRLDSRAAVLEEAERATHASFWVKLRLPRHGRLWTPVLDHDGRRRRDAPLAKAIQLVTDRKTGAISIRLFSDVTETYAVSREAYEAETEAIGLDFGLSTLFATSEGDLLGRRWLDHLKRMDAAITPVARHMQRIGKKPRDARRYRDAVARLRGWLKTEINRVVNRLIDQRKPAHLVLERLDFRNPALSRRLNRILRNCGRRIVADKLRDLEERLGVTSEEVAAAYSSQECGACGFVSRRNRPSQARFACGWCGHRGHADVGAARTILARRSWPDSARLARRKGPALEELARRFLCGKTQAYGRRADALATSAFAKAGIAGVDEILSGHDRLRAA
jgi:putative transposase